MLKKDIKNFETKRTIFDSEIQKIVSNELKIHANEQIGEIIKTDYEFLGYYDKNELVGGVVYRNFWNALEIKYLFVNKNLRGLNLGKKLMLETEEIGKNELNCKISYLSTLSYQALGFYQKLGYEIEFIRDGYSNDVKKYYLYKKL